MKISFFALLFISYDLFALSVLSDNIRKGKVSKTDKVTVKRAAQSRVSASQVNAKEKMLLNQLSFYKSKVKSLEGLNKVKFSYMKIMDDDPLFTPTQMIGGRLRFSILSTNISSPINIIPDPEAGLPEGSVFSCYGLTKYKRVMASCDSVIINGRSQQIAAKVLDVDGSLGLRGHYYSGKEEYVAGMIFSEAAKGMLAVQQTQINTALGPVTNGSAKNAMLQALMNSADESTELLREQMQSKEPKVFVKSNKRVIVYIESMGVSNEF